MSCTISGSSFVFGHNTIHISFGDDDSDELIDVGINSIKKETLIEFKEKFLNKEHCNIKIMDHNGLLSIIYYDNMIEFSYKQFEYTLYTAIHSFEYDICKDAILQFIDFHLSKFK